MNYRKAPKLINKKPKSENFYQVDADFFEMAGKELGYPAFKILMVLVGTKDEFAISEKWICQRASTTTKNYAARDRKQLVEKGYIQFEANCGSITIDYDNIEKKLEKYRLAQVEEIPQAVEKIPQIEEIPQDEEKIITQDEAAVPQVEEIIPQGEENSPQVEGYNIYTNKTNINIYMDEAAKEKENYPKVTYEGKWVEYNSAAAQEIDYEKEVNIILKQIAGTHSLATLQKSANDLLAQGKTYEWIYLGLTDAKDLEGFKKYGLSGFFKGYTRDRADSLINRKKIKATPAATPAYAVSKKIINISSPLVEERRKIPALSQELDELFAEVN